MRLWHSHNVDEPQRFMLNERDQTQKATWHGIPTHSQDRQIYRQNVDWRLPGSGRVDMGTTIVGTNFFRDSQKCSKIRLWYGCTTPSILKTTELYTLNG
jgi:hypothetical protein